MTRFHSRQTGSVPRKRLRTFLSFSVYFVCSEFKAVWHCTSQRSSQFKSIPVLKGGRKEGRCAQWDLEARVVLGSQDAGTVGAEVEAGRLAGLGCRAFSYDLVCAPEWKQKRDTCSISALLIREPGICSGGIFLVPVTKGKGPAWHQAPASLSS